MDLYREDVLDHYKNPRNKGGLVSGSSEKGLNASCGDSVEFEVDMDKGMVESVRWEGEGCAISMASSSKLSEWLEGKSVGEILDMDDEEIASQAVGFEVSDGRKKCMMLPVATARRLLGRS